MSLVDTVRAGGLLAEGRPVVVLYSGGRDSTCLLDLAVRICGREAVSALHVNYGLRDAASDDEQHCRELCDRLGLQLEVRRPLRHAAGNLQAWARDERYGAAARIALDRGADVAAGHTASDQVETILYRLASSPSRRALLGMPDREGLLVRPLLSFTRAETAAYCDQRGLGWREDDSNDSPLFARNRIRAELVPALLAAHPAAERNVLALAQILREEAAVLDALVEDALGGARCLELTRLRELPPALQRLVVQRLADEAAGGLAPGAGRRANEVAALSDRGTAMLDVGSGVRAVAEYGLLRFERLGGSRAAPDAVALSIPGTAQFGDYEVRCELGPPELDDAGAAHSGEAGCRAGSSPAESGVLDRSMLGSELLVRSWRPGDRMAPLGLHGTKSLQDLFTARRVPRRERAAVPVVESEGEIAWVAGVATSEHFKVTPATRQSARLSLRQTGKQGREATPIN